MVRHSHHHLPAHIGGVKYVPPCCGCGGINRQNLRREIAAEKAKKQAGLEEYSKLQQLVKKEPVPQHVREMAGIKIKQHLAKDTVTFSQLLQQKGVSKEKALEKILDKLVAMYNSEKELMKALKKMDMNKLMEILLKALKSSKEAELSEDEILNKKVNKTKQKLKVRGKHKAIQDEEEKEEKERQEKELAEDDSEKIEEFEIIELEEEVDSFNDVEVEEPAAIKSIKLRKFSNPIRINTSELKSSGIKYSSSAKDMLKMQNDIEEDAIRKEMLQKNNADNPFEKQKTPDSVKSNKGDNNEEINKLNELQDENERLKKIILDLQRERRTELLSSISEE